MTTLIAFFVSNINFGLLSGRRTVHMLRSLLKHILSMFNVQFSIFNFQFSIFNFRLDLLFPKHPPAFGERSARLENQKTWNSAMLS
jgi:hypothetical protein